MTAPSPSVEYLLREFAPHALGALIRRYGEFAASEDAVQQALIAAAAQWPREGVPDDPRAWLIRVAARRMADYFRAEAARVRREAAVAASPENAIDPNVDPREDEDDSLILLFMCCHPSLTPASAIALTLRAVGGLNTAEIAHAFLVPEATMAQRISRAKQTIRSSGIPFRLPTDDERADRLGAVLHVLYLIFNEGYTTSGGPDLMRSDLSQDAIRLARMVHAQIPDDGEVAGLLALMLLTDARKAARTGPAGELIPLAQQDRTLWDRRSIEEGVALISAALPRGFIGPYQLQAAIAAIHDEAPTTQDTDWLEIQTLYQMLGRISDNPMVSLNHAIATAMVHGPATGLALLDPLDHDQRLAQHHRLYAVRAHLLEMAGNSTAAIEHYTMAAQRTASVPERHYLLTQAARLRESATGEQER